MSATQCVFRDNSASDDGGAFSVSTANDEITISESDFINNTAYGNGGGIRLYSGNYYATIRNCRYVITVELVCTVLRCIQCCILFYEMKL